MSTPPLPAYVPPILILVPWCQKVLGYFRDFLFQRLDPITVAGAGITFFLSQRKNNGASRATSTLHSSSPAP